MIQNELHEILFGIEMRATRFEEWRFQWRIQPASDDEQVGWNIQCSFERPDANSSEYGIGYGRKWFVASTASIESVVFTAWLAIQQIITHELHESFTVRVDGKSVRLLDPHKRLVDLAVGSAVLS